MNPMMECRSCGHRGTDLVPDSEGDLICKPCAKYWADTAYSGQGEKIIFHRIAHLQEGMAMLESQMAIVLPKLN